jgi:hypothetical protein
METFEAYSQQAAYPGPYAGLQGHLEPADLQQQLLGPLQQYAQPPATPTCPKSRSLYNQLVSQLSMAACEVQMEHMALGTASFSSSTTSSASGCSNSSSFSAASSRHNSVSGPGGLNSMPGSIGSTTSPISTDAFQNLLFQMLQEEWATQSLSE